MAGEQGGSSGPSPAATPIAGAGRPGEEDGGYDSKCVFCRITHGEETGTELLPCEYEDLVCFRDIRPGAPHHYLVLPKNHTGNCKTLKSEHIPLLERMMAVGKAILQWSKCTNLDDIRMGFHWPPFCSIAHLHLHVLAPASQLGFLSRMIYRLNSYWFITAEQLMERLKAESTTS
ncbi:histidine triad nucleotide-binding protein 3 [Crotalus adamanteus]|uniref:Adenosine 5'-monophosphoramidase HINT3 n=1 Tax=Crotalus adamanteus TaxID=8729 RepID=A0AAW1CAZ7_CROAD